ncbi:MAG TPA: hypothetical protein VGJ33_07950 [Candidatus Angelobacter sp.]|jgi:hypothetical protein
MEMNWSRWFHCESSFGLLLVPSQPGVFALAEEIVQPAGPASRRMLAVFEVAEADDLSRAMSRLFAVGSPVREKLLQARCYIRYAIAPGIADRRAAAAALKNWLNAKQEVASQIFERPANVPSELELTIAPAQVLARPEQRSVAETADANPVKVMAAAAVPDYSESEHGGQKTVAERAVDRVTHGIRLSKAVSAGF